MGKLEIGVPARVPVGPEEGIRRGARTEVMQGSHAGIVIGCVNEDEKP